LAVIHDSQGRGIGTENPLIARIQSKYSKTVQTHSAVSIALSAWNTSATWIDCDGFDKIALTLLNDAATGSTVNVLWSHDGVTQQGEDSSVITTGNLIRKAGVTDVKARYAKVSINNADATAAHVMSAWAYLKA
jgi:hypothetical protein